MPLVRSTRLSHAAPPIGIELEAAHLGHVRIGIERDVGDAIGSAGEKSTGLPNAGS